MEFNTPWGHPRFFSPFLYFQSKFPTAGHQHVVVTAGHHQHVVVRAGHHQHVVFGWWPQRYSSDTPWWPQRYSSDTPWWPQRYSSDTPWWPQRYSSDTPSKPHAKIRMFKACRRHKKSSNLFQNRMSVL